MAAILAKDMAKWIFLIENNRIPIQISFKFVSGSPIDNMPASVYVMACCNMWQAIAWANGDPVHWHMYVSLGLNELMQPNWYLTPKAKAQHKKLWRKKKYFASWNHFKRWRNVLILRPLYDWITWWKVNIYLRVHLSRVLPDIYVAIMFTLLMHVFLTTYT